MKKILCIIFVFSILCGCRAIEPPLKQVEIETETEFKFNVPVIRYTSEEAESLFNRFEEEREDERRAEEQRRAALIQTGIYSASYFRRAGRIHWNGCDWTWYSERILPGYGLRIPGRHTDANGYVRDGNGFLCLASDAHRRGTILETPFGGHGKVYDCGCGNNYTIDVYVGW